MLQTSSAEEKVGEETGVGVDLCAWTRELLGGKEVPEGSQRANTKRITENEYSQAMLKEWTLSKNNVVNSEGLGSCKASARHDGEGVEE